MKTSDLVENTINRLPVGYVFTYGDFNIEVEMKNTVLKHLSRMTEQGEIIKLSKGKYYKPEKSKFGNVPLSEYQVVKDLLEKDGKTIGYITGLRAYNELGLTTQLSNTIEIGSNERFNPKQRGIFKIKFVNQKNTITSSNTSHLRILDAIKFIKTIPDSNIDSSITRLLSIFKKYSKSESRTIARLSLKYPPSTRALLGAMLEISNATNDTNALYTSLTHISKYDIGVSEKTLPNKNKWRII